MSSTSKLAYLILALGIGYMFVYPAFSDISALMDEKQKNEDSLALFANIENKKNELLTKFNNIPADEKKDIDTILPNSLDFVKTIAQIDAVASKYGISIKQITLTADNPSGESIETAEAAKPYQSSLIGFSFTSSYENFRSFMDDLEKSMRILDSRSVKISAQENGLYIFNVQFETYWLE